MAIALGYNALVTRFNLAVPPLRQTFWQGARAAGTRTQALDFLADMRREHRGI
jgi:hypothetical protein